MKHSNFYTKGKPALDSNEESHNSVLELDR